MREFTKWHGLGNDFLLVDGRQGVPTIREVRRVCDRHRGIGADGVIVLRPDGESQELEMVIYNCDGSRPQMCGNGVRCAAAMAHHEWKFGEELSVLSDAGPRRCAVTSLGGLLWDVDVEMGAVIPGASREALITPLGEWTFWRVDAGNPHAVVFDWPEIDVVDAVGAMVNKHHPLFPEGVNLEFVRHRQDGGLDVLVYERGVGRTRACGTGACAVAVAHWEEVGSKASTVVHLPGGALSITPEGGDLGNVRMRGEAALICRGEWFIDEVITGSDEER